MSNVGKLTRPLDIPRSTMDGDQQDFQDDDIDDGDLDLSPISETYVFGRVLNVKVSPQYPYLILD